MSILARLAMLVAGAFIVFFGSPIRREVVVGPSLQGYVSDHLQRLVSRQHVLAAILAVAVAFVSVYPRSWCLELLPAIAVGWPVGRWWSKLRMGKAYTESAGPEESVPEEKLFPSDRGARLMHIGYVPPLPVSIDLAFLAGCLSTGFLLGMIAYWIVAR